MNRVQPVLIVAIVNVDKGDLAIPTYLFVCNRCHTEFEHYLSFLDFDKLEAGKISIKCGECGSTTKREMGGQNVFIYDATPKTLGSLADKNTKYLLPRHEEKLQKEKEQAKKDGKLFRHGSKINYEDRHSSKQKEQRLDRRNEFIERKNSESLSKRSTRNNNNNRRKTQRTKK